MVALIYAFRVQMDFPLLITLLFGIFTLYTPIKNLSKLHTTIQKSLASTDRIFSVLDSVPTVKESSSAIQLKPIQQSIRFENVSFRYETHDVLHNVSLEIQHGKAIALVGPSGGGKTTLLNLVLRFYDPTHGKILVDGIDIKDVSFDSLRKQIGVVTQENILFNDTIRNNLRYGSLEASEEQIIRAATQAYAHDFILQQPQGYETIVGDKGVKLSGGQKQRLAIARALLKNPSILLLDEATNALDTESERYVQAALDVLVKGRTVIVIAHRLSTVQNADLIVVLEKGRIAEQGKHDELLKQNKLYRKLYDLQFAEMNSSVS
jgi:subfamily B ATP-binding cassette protein MsbA